MLATLLMWSPNGHGSGGVVIGGSSNVFLNGKPAAQAGSPIADCKGY